MTTVTNVTPAAPEAASGNGVFSADQRAAIDSANAEAEAHRTGSAPIPAEDPVVDTVDQTPPDLILGKFKTQDDLAAAYKALEAKLGAPKDEAKPEAPAEGADGLAIKKDAEPKAEGEAPVEGAEAPAESINGKVVTEDHRKAWTDHLTSFGKDGKLSDEAYAFAAAEFGVTDKTIVESYARGQIAEQQLVSNASVEEILTVAGGKAEYAKITDWAAKSLSEAELAEYNDAVTYGSQREAKLAVQNLKLRFVDAEPLAPAAPLSGDTSTTSSDTPGFNSYAEMTAAINKLDDQGRRLYDYDKAYRNKVEARIAVTSDLSSARY